MSQHTNSESQLRWYQGLEPYCWLVLIIAALGWLFDTMDQNLFNLVRTPSIQDLLSSSIQDPDLLEAETRRIGGWITAIFLVGWSVGGFIFGILGDRLGRTRTMILTILIYAAFTGLSALAWNWQSYAAVRFMTGLGVGGEWAAGAAIVAEVFPERSRAMALGTLQALSALGNMMAAVVTFTLAGLSWRYVYLVGALPALLVVWIRRSLHEPERWIEAREKASVGRELGTIGELLRDRQLRRNTIAALMMAVAGQAALWGIGFWSVDLLTSVLDGLSVPRVDVDRTKSLMFFVQQAGAMLGIYLFAVFSEWTTRRRAFFVWFGLGWVSIPVFFWGVAMAPSVLVPGILDSVLAPLTFLIRTCRGSAQHGPSRSSSGLLPGFRDAGSLFRIHRLLSRTLPDTTPGHGLWDLLQRGTFSGSSRSRNSGSPHGSFCESAGGRGRRSAHGCDAGQLCLSPGLPRRPAGSGDKGQAPAGIVNLKFKI